MLLMYQVKEKAYGEALFLTSRQSPDGLSGWRDFCAVRHWKCRQPGGVAGRHKKHY